MRRVYLALTLFFLLLNIGSVSAQIEYQQGTLQYATTFFSDPRSSRIVCSDIFPSECAFLTFDNNILTKAVKLVYTIDNFTTIYAQYVVPNSDLSQSVDFLGEYYPLPFDITYFNGTFYFFVANKMYNFTRVNGIQLMYSLAGYYSGLNFVDDGSIWMVQKACQSGGNYAGTYWAYTTNGTLTKIADELTCNCGTGQSITKAQGWGAKNGNTWRWYWKNYIPYGAGVNCSSSNMGSFPSDFNGLFYYDGNRIVYHRAENVTANVTGGVWQTVTDLTTFQSPTLLYGENKSIAEKIRASDYKTGLGFNIYAFERNTNSSYSPSGIYVYYEKQYIIRIEPSFWNINTLSQESDTITASFKCGNVTKTYSGTSIVASISCSNPEITIISNYEPNIYTFTYNIPSGCEDSVNYIFPTYYKPYWVKLYAIDEMTGNYIDGVTINIDSQVNTTSSEGYAEFYIYPLINTTFNIEKNEPQCYWSLKTIGNPKAFQVYSTKTGYKNNYETITFIDKIPEDVSDFKISESISMIRESSTVTVYLYTKDSVEISPISAIVRENGSQVTYWYYNNDYYLTNVVSDSLPVKFILVDNRTSWDTNISVEYFGKVYYQVLTVEKNKNYRVNLYIDDLATNMSCISNEDCKSSFCKGNIYKEFKGCINNRCTYKNVECLSSFLCDDLIGCFDIKTNDRCENDLDCNTTCLNNYTMGIGKCLSDGYCGIIKRICNEGCNYTLGACEELKECLYGTEKSFTVYLYKNGVGVLGSSITIRCDLDNAGKSFCVPAVDIKKSDLEFHRATINDLYVYPEDWAYIDMGDYYHFYPISVTCSETCEITYETCETDCSFETGKCVGAGNPINPAIENITGYMGMFVMTLEHIFPTIYSRTLVSSIFIITLVSIIVYYLNKINSSSNWQIGVSISIIMVGALAFVGWFDPLITIIFIIIAGFILVKYTFWG